MKKYLNVLSQCPLFDGIDHTDIENMLGCLDGKMSSVSKGNPVFVLRAQLLYITLMFYNAVIMHWDCENFQTVSLDRRV